MYSAKKKIVGGLVWTYAERIAAQLVSLLVTIVLARLIEPEHYGVISIVSIFMVIADTFVVGGFGNSLIQKKNADNIDFSSVFYFNIIFSVLLYVVLFFGAIPIANFYGMPILVKIIRIMGLHLPFAAVNSVQQAYVSRKMEFRKFFFATIIGTVISACVGITMAYHGMGVWALVTQYMTNTICDTVILWVTVKWRPEFVFSTERLKSLLSYGWKILATSLMITLYSNIQDLIIGKKYSSTSLAYSNKGRQFPSLISTNINTSISKVLFPAIAEYQDDLIMVKRLTRRAIAVGTYILSPILVGLAAIASPFVIVVLTENWLQCVPFLQIMCIVYLFQPIQTASLQAMKALGRSDLYLKLEIIKIVGVVILIIAVVGFNNVLAIIVGTLFSELVATIIDMPANKKLLNYSYKEQMQDIFPSLLLALFMGGLLVRLPILPMRPLGVIGIQILIGAIIYICGSAIFKVDSFLYIANTLKPHLLKNQKEGEVI